MEQIILNGISVDELLERFKKLIDSKKESENQFKSFETSKLLSRKEVCSLLKITLPTLHDWTKQGKLQSYKIGNRVLYKKEEVEEAINNLAQYKFKKG